MSEAVRENYQDDLGYEILNGKMVNMSPASTTHTTVVGNIHRVLSTYFRGKPCRVFVDGLMVCFSENDKIVPDVMIVCRPEIIKEDGVHGSPDLIVEVLSSSTAFKDKGYKKNLYEKNDVREYWIVDNRNRAVEVYHLGDEGYILDQLYIQHTPTDRKLMTDEELQQLLQVVQSNIFADMAISLEEIFENT